MAKDTYYFSHDFNARNDKKISALVREFKSSGYGIYWCVAEMLHEEKGKVELDELTFMAISNDLNEDLELVKNVINKCVYSFKLFRLSDDNMLTSNRVEFNLDKRKQLSISRSNAGKAGAIAKQAQAIAEQNEAKKGKKGKESKSLKGGFNTMPLAKDFNGIPKEYIDQSIQLLHYSGNKGVIDSQITGMWDIFKVQNLTGKNHYPNEGKVYSHFINWIKDKKIKTEIKDEKDMNHYI